MSKVIYIPPVGPPFDFTTLNASGWAPDFSVEMSRDENSGIMKVQHTIRMAGAVFADGATDALMQADLTAKHKLLMDLKDGGILRFEQDNGDTIWQYDGAPPVGPNPKHYLTSEGVEIGPRKWPPGDAAWASNAPGEITFRADVINDPCDATGIQSSRYSTREVFAFGRLETVEFSGTLRTCDGSSCRDKVIDLITSTLEPIARAKFGSPTVLTPTSVVITDLGSRDQHCGFIVTYSIGGGGSTAGTSASALDITSTVTITGNKAIIRIVAIYSYAGGSRNAVKADAETLAGVTLSKQLPSGVNTPHTERTREFSENRANQTFTAVRVYEANWIHDPSQIVEFSERITFKRPAEGAQAHRLTTKRSASSPPKCFIQTSGLGPVEISIQGRVVSALAFLKVPPRVNAVFGSLPVQTDPSTEDYEIPTLNVDTSPAGQSEAQFITTYTQTYMHDDILSVPIIPMQRLISQFTPVTEVT